MASVENLNLRAEFMQGPTQFREYHTAIQGMSQKIVRRPCVFNL